MLALCRAAQSRPATTLTARPAAVPVVRAAAGGRAPTRHHQATAARHHPPPRRNLARAAAAADDDGPSTAREAIDAGIARLEAGDADAALTLFTRALSLPGRGLKRFRDKPAGVSDGEKQAALFNCACAYARLGDTAKGLEAVAGCLEAGYEDVATLRGDPDLAPLRADPRFEGLIARLAPAGGGGGGFGGLLKGFFGK